MEPGRSLERCSDVRLVQCGAEVSGLDPVLSAGMHWQGTSPPCRLPRMAPTRVGVSGLDQLQLRNQTILTNDLGVVMDAKEQLIWNGAGKRRNLVRKEAHCNLERRHCRWA